MGSGRNGIGHGCRCTAYGDADPVGTGFHRCRLRAGINRIACALVSDLADLCTGHSQIIFERCFIAFIRFSFHRRLRSVQRQGQGVGVIFTIRIGASCRDRIPLGGKLPCMGVFPQIEVLPGFIIPHGVLRIGRSDIFQHFFCAGAAGRDLPFGVLPQRFSRADGDGMVTGVVFRQGKGLARVEMHILRVVLEDHIAVDRHIQRTTTLLNLII